MNGYDSYNKDETQHTRDELSHAIADALILARKKRMSWDRLFSIIATIISIVAVVFAAGINWSRLAYVESQVYELRTRTSNLENTSANQNSDLSVIKSQLDTVNENLIDLKSAIYVANQGRLPRFDPKKNPQ